MQDHTYGNFENSRLERVFKDSKRLMGTEPAHDFENAAGASWAAVWFRMKGQKNPTSEQFRLKTAEYFRLLEPLFSTYPDSEEFKEISSYIRHRSTEEIEKILAGENDEIEKRYKRYLDYG